MPMVTLQERARLKVKGVYCAAFSSDQRWRQENPDRNDDALHQQGQGQSSSSDSTTFPLQNDQNNRDSKDMCRLLATCGGTHVLLYLVTAPTSTYESLFPVQAYHDASDEEEFYACEFAGRSLRYPFHWNTSCEFETSLYIDENGAGRPSKRTKDDQFERKSPNGINDDDYFDWLHSTEGPQLLCVGGKAKTIKVIDTVRRRLAFALEGHADQIFDLKRSPANEWFLLSASVDKSARLWNLRDGSLFCILSGHQGHSDSVNSCAWHMSGRSILTGGHDTAVKLWDVRSVIEREEQRHVESRLEPRGVERIQFPIFSNKLDLHVHCVDCVAFVGDLVLSKSIENRIEMYLPNLVLPADSPVARPSSDLSLLWTFPYKFGQYWFVKFAVDPLGRYLAVGDSVGQVYLWDLDQPGVHIIGEVKRKVQIRSVTFSSDSTTLVATTDDREVIQWDIVATLD